jgi:hypothetical protein
MAGGHDKRCSLPCRSSAFKIKLRHVLVLSTIFFAPSHQQGGAVESQPFQSRPQSSTTLVTASVSTSPQSSNSVSTTARSTSSGTSPSPQQQTLSPGSIPLIVTNQCSEEIYPAINTQHSTGPATNGFQLGPGESRNLSVAHDWQGRVWGRTNCSFTNDHSSQRACRTGDCAGALDCQVAVR